MTLPAESAASLPETVCGTDERVRVNPETSPPYNWICSLDITALYIGTKYHGSGFKIHIPNINRCIVVTSGHCVYVNGAYADNITVTFPGQAAVRVRQADLYAHPQYVDYSNENYDYGIIILPGNSDEGFGWSAIITDSELSGRIVTNCGYPADKHPWPQMWITGGEVTEVTDNRLYYMNDTMPGQSGSPVYTWYKGYWTVVGVHSYGGCPNSSPRFTGEMIYCFLERTQNLKKYALESLEFRRVYIRCDGHEVDRKVNRGTGVINCQFGPPSDWETFYIYPVEVTPSLAQHSEQKYIVALKNCKWPNTFVRMDGSHITEYKNEGGGVVNCQWSGIPPSSWESFVLKKVWWHGQSGYSFHSVKFPNRYIRADGRRVTKHANRGEGVINCQHYDKYSPIQGPTGWELFFMREK